MYPCIRDDLLFVADTANAIISALESTDSSDRTLILRVSWSLGNLSDTLVVNKGNNPSFVSDFSDLLLGRLVNRTARELFSLPPADKEGSLSHYLPPLDYWMCP